MAKFISKYDLIRLMGDERNSVQFLFDESLLNTSQLCSECGAPMVLKSRVDRRYPHFECAAGHEKITISCSKGTWFEMSKMSPIQIMLVTHCFAVNNSYKQTVIEASMGNTKLSAMTISDWFNYCREVCMISMEDKYRRGKIGGPGHIVEIDECKIGTRKYRRGGIMEGNWILGMIDRNTKDVRMTICPGNQKDGATLYNLISEHVETTSTIHTDCWGEYNGLMASDFAAHLTTNHSQHSRRVHTNSIESQFRTLRRSLTRGGIRQKDMDVHICEYLWRKDCESRNADPFQELIEYIRKMYPMN